MRIAWVDDDTDIIGPVIELVRREGHEILELRSVAEVQRNLEYVMGCDLVLLDIILPHGVTAPEEIQENDASRYAGVEVLRRLREEGCQTPVVVLSVVTRSSVLDEVERLGVARENILQKPVLPSELKGVIDGVAAGRQG